MNNNEISNLMNMLGNMDKDQLANGLNQLNQILGNEEAATQSTSSAANSESTSSPDLETIMKIKSTMESINNQNSSSSNLLYSLKPYLRKSKQAKLDQYVNLLKISQINDLLKKEKGDTN